MVKNKSLFDRIMGQMKYQEEKVSKGVQILLCKKNYGKGYRDMVR